jgi:hypothetical protein
MKNYVITSGSFTSNGNFSGYNALGERVHFHKRQMEAMKWAKNEDVKYPFFAIGAVTQIGQLDENNEPKLNSDGSPVLVNRLTALSAFATKAELVAAHVDSATIDIEIKGAISVVAKSTGLNDKAVEALLAASI